MEETKRISLNISRYIGVRQIFNKLFLTLVFILITLPLFTTFNEILTKIAEKSGGGGHTFSTKLETLVLVISGTFLVNIFRITSIVVTAYYYGEIPSAIVHNYGGTLFTMYWFFFYWWFSCNYILEDNII